MVAVQWRHIFLWEHSENKFKSFIDKINKVYPTIKFTAEWSKTSINFLDVTVSLIEGAIETDLYVKPTDSHQYLQSSSYHPFHCENGIPLRLNHICSEMNAFDKQWFGKVSLGKRIQFSTGVKGNTSGKKNSKKWIVR